MHTILSLMLLLYQHICPFSISVQAKNDFIITLLIWIHCGRNALVQISCRKIPCPPPPPFHHPPRYHAKFVECLYSSSNGGYWCRFSCSASWQFSAATRMSNQSSPGKVGGGIWLYGKKLYQCIAFKSCVGNSTIWDKLSISGKASLWRANRSSVRI